MQVLLYVTTILMMIAIMTYGRLESFRNLAGAQGEFTNYMEKTERAYLNEGAEKTYSSVVATNLDKEEKKKEKNAPGSPKVNFAYFVDEQMHEKNKSLHDQFLLVTKNLINFLYADQVFYQNIQEKRPDFLNEIFEDLNKQDKEIKNAKDLATIVLKDRELQQVWYKMLDGTPGEPEDDDNFKRVPGYDSLLDFISIDNKTQIRIYLASPQVLTALFGNPSIVQNIIDERYNLYKEVAKKEDAMDPKEAAAVLKSLFEEQRLPGIQDTLLDYTVSKSYPRKNERKKSEKPL